MLTRVQVFEGSHSVVTVDFNELLLEVHVDSFACGDWSQSISEFLAIREHITDSGVEINIGPYLLITPSFLGEVHNFLGGATTLDRHSWQGEDSFTTLEVLAHL